MDYSLLTIFSFFIGIVVGLTGIGGSSEILGLKPRLCKTVHGFLTVVCDGGGSRNLNREV